MFFSLSQLTDLESQRQESPSSAGKKLNRHRLDRASCDTLTQLDQGNVENKNQKNITYVSIAIIFIFLICQLPRGIWLCKSGMENKGDISPHSLLSNCLQGIDYHYNLNISRGKVGVRNFCHVSDQTADGLINLPTHWPTHH